MISPDRLAPPSGRPLTGRAVLFMFVAFFGTVFAVNFVMLRLATGTFRGVVTDSSYQASQRFNQVAQEARDQAARGWSIDTSVTRLGEGTEIVLVAKDAEGRPLDDLSGRIQLTHPADKRLDRDTTLRPLRGGRYAASLEGVPAGQWDVVLTLEREDARLFLSRNRIVLR
jgi:nitrogen fixation protein FixH